MNTCSLCKYWDGRPNEDGFCRRYPPVAITDTGTHPEYGLIETVKTWEHPETHHSDWCGEFQPQATHG